MRPLKIVSDAFQYADDSSHYAWAHTDAYPDYGFYFSGDTAKIRSLCEQRRSLVPGPNGVRTFFCWLRGGFTIDPKTKDFYTKIGAYLDLLAEYGLYCNLTNGDYAQAGIDQYDHLMKLMDGIGTRPAFLSGCNENSGNGADNDAITRALSQHPANILVSIGSGMGGGPCPLPMPGVSGQFAEQHIRRDISMGMYGDICPLFMQHGGSHPEYPNGYPGVGMIPVPTSEPIGCADVSIPNRRTNDSNVFFKMARTSSAWNGMTFHNDGGQTGQLLTPTQFGCAAAFFTGIF